MDDSYLIQARTFDFGLSGRARLGYAALGFVAIPFGVLAAYVATRRKPAGAKSDAVRFAVYGALAGAAALAVAAAALGFLR